MPLVYLFVLADLFVTIPSGPSPLGVPTNAPSMKVNHPQKSKVEDLGYQTMNNDESSILSLQHCEC